MPRGPFASADDHSGMHTLALGSHMKPVPQSALARHPMRQKPPLQIWWSMPTRVLQLASLEHAPGGVMPPSPGVVPPSLGELPAQAATLWQLVPAVRTHES